MTPSDYESSIYPDKLVQNPYVGSATTVNKQKADDTEATLSMHVYDDAKPYKPTTLRSESKDELPFQLKVYFYDPIKDGGLHFKSTCCLKWL